MAKRQTKQPMPAAEMPQNGINHYDFALSSAGEFNTLEGATAVAEQIKDDLKRAKKEPLLKIYHNGEVIESSFNYYALDIAPLQMENGLYCLIASKK